jgi:hypothetical protein
MEVKAADPFIEAFSWQTNAAPVLTGLARMIGSGGATAALR